jgi:copper(I)-binding protein
VKNTGDEPDRLMKIESDIADTIEIHEVEVKDGAMTMQHQHDGVEIAAGKEIVLEPGSDHVMLIGITKSLVDGEEFTATLHFEKAGEVEITVPIYAAEPGEDEGEPVEAGEDLEISGIWARQAPKLDGMGTPSATPES